MEQDHQEIQIVTPGELVTADPQFMRGHGTYILENNQIVASIAGSVQRVNKLISVQSVKGRYTAEIGDVVVGRILEVGMKRWKVDLGAYQDGILMLSSVNLPGGVQRRKLESDELQMRSFFSEGDMVVAEVQQLFADGAISLHTRSLKYGKLRNGCLVKVPPTLIKRSKAHFNALAIGIDLILGLNGYVWVRKHTPEPTMEQIESNPDALYGDSNEECSKSMHESIARAANCVKILARHFLYITDMVVMTVYELSLQFPVHEILLPDVASILISQTREQIQQYSDS